MQRRAMPRAHDHGRITLKIDEQATRSASSMYLPCCRNRAATVYGTCSVLFACRRWRICCSESPSVSLDIHDAPIRRGNLLYAATRRRSTTAKLVHGETLMVGGRPWTLTLPAGRTRSEADATRSLRCCGWSAHQLAAVQHRLCSPLPATAPCVWHGDDRLAARERARFRYWWSRRRCHYGVRRDLGRFVDAMLRRKAVRCTREELLKVDRKGSIRPADSAEKPAENAQVMIERALAGTVFSNVPFAR